MVLQGAATVHTDDIEMRVCKDQDAINEDIAVEFISIIFMFNTTLLRAVCEARQ